MFSAPLLGVPSHPFAMMPADFLDALRPSWVSDSESYNEHDDVLLVDAADRPIGSINKMLAHERGLRHRAVSVLIRNSHNDLLLQQRAADKYHSPGLWSNT